MVRSGRRAGRPLLALHALSGDEGPARAGLVVSRAVGGSVVRHRVARRLRHLLAVRLPALPAGTRLVVRANPPAGTATSAALGAAPQGPLRALGLISATSYRIPGAVLPAAHRLRTSREFSQVVRGGRRAGRPLLTVHLDSEGTDRTAGLVVSKAVGGSVVRHRVARRLRHLLAARLPELPAGTRLVVRAAPAAANATSAALGADLDRALARLVRP